MKPVALSSTYRLGLAAATVAMVLLPVLYVAIVAGAAFGVYTWATEGLALVGYVRPLKLAIVLYGAPLVVGAILVVFMIKPLFAPRAERQAPRTLRREEEPLLFPFVERVAEAVGAPTPRRIDVDCQVNASASFRRGLASFAGRDLVLTIGMPLVSALSLEQLAGILAHELGHFAQGAGMRLSYLIRSINLWFHRVVYERDGWDQGLDEARRNSGSWVVSGVLHLSTFFLFVTRGILNGLMQVGHVVSSYLLRQMEFDADRYEARLVGSRTFETTCRELNRLGVAYEESLADLSELWSEGKLSRSLPDLVVINRQQLTPRVLARIEKAVDEARTERFSTHPADRDRIASAYREGPVGVFRSDLPARALFRDYDTLATMVSRDFYQSVLGDAVAEESLRTSEEMLARKASAAREREATDRYFGPLAPLLGLPPLPDATALAAPEERLAALAERRRRLAERAAQLPAPNDDPAHEGPEPDVVQELRKLAGERLSLALALASDRRTSDGDEITADHPRLHAAYRGLVACGPELAGLQGGLMAVTKTVTELRDWPDELEKSLSDLFEKLHRTIGQTHDKLVGIEYPFDHAAGEVGLVEVVVRGRPDIFDPAGLISLAEDVLQQAASLQSRLLGRLLVVAQQAETEAGLAPLALGGGGAPEADDGPPGS